MIKGITLVSGGLDSTLMTVLLNEQGFGQTPLFIDYGQLAVEKEWESCQANFSRLSLPKPERLDINGYGKFIASGITNTKKRLAEDAFLPCRNLVFLIMAAAAAVQSGGSFVSIGLLSQRFALFPDQKQNFLDSTETTLKLALGLDIKVLVPLFDFSKADVIVLAKQKGVDISQVYSCHAGTEKPCGICISCKERISAMQSLNKENQGAL